MKYRINRADVIEKRGDQIVVRLQTKDDFRSCVEKGCNLCTAPSKEQKMTIPVSAAHEYEIGDFVFVHVPVLNEAVAAAAVFILPLLFTMISFLFLTALLKWPPESGKTISVLLITFFCSLALPVVVDYLIKKRFPVSLEKKGEC